MCPFMQHWSKVEHSVREPCPVGRSGHAAVCLGYGRDHPQLLVIGGLTTGNKVLGDAWLLDVQSGKWKEVRIPDVHHPHLRKVNMHAGQRASKTPGEILPQCHCHQPQAWTRGDHLIWW